MSSNSSETIVKCLCSGNNTTSSKTNGTEDDIGHGGLVYRSVMFFIFAVGFVGNLLTVIVFVQKRHRSKIISPYILNLAMADLFIIIFGYPVVISATLSSQKLLAGTAKCTWSAFVNGSVGIASIATLTEISYIMCRSITSIQPKIDIHKKRIAITILGAWIYGILTVVPPLFGWSRFVPGTARVSCAPDWSSDTFQSLVYNIALMIMGFFLPLAIILISYYKIYRALLLNSVLSRQKAILVRRRKSQVKVVRMIAASVLAFVLSWSPYCVVCLIAMIKHEYIISSGEAEIPELMAKASVIYNPFVYIAMNRDIRKTVKCLLNRSSFYQRSEEKRKFGGHEKWGVGTRRLPPNSVIQLSVANIDHLSDNDELLKKVIASQNTMNRSDSITATNTA
ncbi:Melanopsin [Exaiptasia diaphana]|nr:Melanopsin [Exaiptasia diaphana]